MSVIIRLQNLPWSANALDIRQYFHGLNIPEGGVHIVGGEQGDAFIAFSTDEDARQAFSRSNGRIKEVQISLMLSSRTEMQKVIEAARSQSYAAFMPTPAQTMPLPAAVPQIIPAAVPEIKKDSKDSKRDRKRSRSRSRDRKDRDRRRYRDRSRSRSRDRRDRRGRRERSRSRGRSRSKDRDRKIRDRKRSVDVNVPQKDNSKKPTEIWANHNDNMTMASRPQNNNMMMANNFGDANEARRNLGIVNPPMGMQGRNNVFDTNFSTNSNMNMMANRGRESWPPQNIAPAPSNNGGFINRMETKMPLPMRPPQMMQPQGNRPPFQNQRFPRNNFQADQMSVQPSERPEREPMPNSCIKLHPFYGGYGDIRRFFQGSFISNVGIKFINDEYGHRTGTVYVQFGHPKGKSDAMHKSGDILNGIKVEIAHLSDREFDESVDRYQPDSVFNKGPNGDDGRSSSKFKNKNITKYFHGKSSEPELSEFSCLTVDDLPTYVKEQDILKMFSSRPLLSLILTTKVRGGHIAYVKFGSEEEAKKALDDTQSHIIESKPVTVRPCSDEDFETINQEHDVDLDHSNNKTPTIEIIDDNIDTDCLKITRLPLQVNSVDIADFFSDIGVRPMKIHLISNRQGFTGEAFCEFKNSDDSTEAMKKDNASFGPNQVIVEPISRDEMQHILQQTMNNPSMHSQNSNSMRHNQTMMNQNRAPFFQRNQFNDSNGPRGLPDPRFMNRGGPAGPRPPRYVGPEDAPPGCTVFMDNVPYKAGTNEILDFFDGYDVTNNVSRRFNPNNTPSAEAKVIFTTPEEAFRAIQEKNGHKIWDRPVFLKQA